MDDIVGKAKQRYAESVGGKEVSYEEAIRIQEAQIEKASVPLKPLKLGTEQTYINDANMQWERIMAESRAEINGFAQELTGESQPIGLTGNTIESGLTKETFVRNFKRFIDDLYCRERISIDMHDISEAMGFSTYFKRSIAQVKNAIQKSVDRYFISSDDGRMLDAQISAYIKALTTYARDFHLKQMGSVELEPETHHTSHRQSGEKDDRDKSQTKPSVLDLYLVRNERPDSGYPKFGL